MCRAIISTHSELTRTLTRFTLPKIYNWVKIGNHIETKEQMTVAWLITRKRFKTSRHRIESLMNLKRFWVFKKLATCSNHSTLCTETSRSGIIATLITKERASIAPKLISATISMRKLPFKKIKSTYQKKTRRIKLQVNLELVIRADQASRLFLLAERGRLTLLAFKDRFIKEARVRQREALE